MLTPEQIPDAVIDAAVAMRDRGGSMSDIIRTAINAWPGVKLENLCGWVMDGPDLPYVEETASIILPITEPRDE